MSDRVINVGDVEGIPAHPWGVLLALQDAIRAWEQDPWDPDKTNALDWAITVTSAKWGAYMMERWVYAWKTGRKI